MKDHGQELTSIVGEERFIDDPAELYCYSFDSSYVRGKADYVVRPRDVGQVSSVVRFANENKIPVIPRGGGSGLIGGAVPVEGGIVLDMTSMADIVSIEIENLQVVSQPGVTHARINSTLEKERFFFPPDPSSSKMCTIGGLIATGGSGMRSLKYGTTRDYVLDLEVVLADGSVIRTGSKALKNASGYDLTRLFVGSEGTLGVITEVTLKLAPMPEDRSVVLTFFDRLEDSGKAVVSILSSGIMPSAIELLDRLALKAVKKYDPSLKLPDVEAALIFEIDGFSDTVKHVQERVAKLCREAGATEALAPSNAEEKVHLWEARRLSGVAISALDPEKVRVYDAEDVCVPISKIPEMLRSIQRISKKNDLQLISYGHVGDGNLHTGITIDLRDDESWKKIEEVKKDIYAEALRLGGTLSGEHGTGYLRRDFMDQAHGPAMGVMRSIKKALDPKGILNPGKLGV